MRTRWFRAAQAPLSTYDPIGNARAAIIISGNGTNWHPGRPSSPAPTGGGA